MTVAEATVIADNALEHTVRTILAALQAPEILKSTSGNKVHSYQRLEAFETPENLSNPASEGTQAQQPCFHQLASCTGATCGQSKRDKYIVCSV